MKKQSSGTWRKIDFKGSFENSKTSCFTFWSFQASSSKFTQNFHTADHEVVISLCLHFSESVDHHQSHSFIEYHSLSSWGASEKVIFTKIAFSIESGSFHWNTLISTWNEHEKIEKHKSHQLIAFQFDRFHQVSH